MNAVLAYEPVATDNPDILAVDEILNEV